LIIELLDLFDVRPFYIYWAHAIREGFFFWWMAEKKTEDICDERVSEIYDDDFRYFKPVFPHVIL
jgi:hypothetical protein